MSRRFVTAAFDAVVTGGQFCGSIIAIAGVMFVPVKTLMDVEELKKTSAELKQTGQKTLVDVEELKTTLARIEKKMQG